MPTTNAEAYEAFLKGRHFAQKGNKKAVEFFEQAIVHDPAYAPAYAGLANSLLFRAPAREFMPRAKEAALKALDLDDALPEAHAALGLVKLMYEWDWHGAEKTFRRALELDPADPETHLRYSSYLAAVGKLDEAIAVARRAQKLDPLAPLPGHVIGRYYTFAGQTDRAIEEYQKSLELHPDFYWSNLFLSFAYEDKGMHDQWFAYQMKAWRIGGVSPERLAEEEKVFSELGYEGVLRRIIERREENARRGYMPSSAISINYIRLGEREKALYWLEKAFEHHTRDLIYLKVEPNYDPLRSDPRFQSLLRRMNFPE
jgi:tetratricopeptide (TPR) repeat protein